MGAVAVSVVQGLIGADGAGGAARVWLGEAEPPPLAQCTCSTKYNAAHGDAVERQMEHNEARASSGSDMPGSLA